MRPSRVLLLALLATFLVAAPARAMIRIPAVPAQVAYNPSQGLIAEPIEDSQYDPAIDCSKLPKPGMAALQRWLEANVRGKHQASLHAEGRAIDWHVDARDPTDRRAAEQLVRLLLAPDSLGNPQALARRMGVEEMIFDCGYWERG